jgi:hypothetical protein
MSTTDFLPAREAELVVWIGTFKALITANPTTYGLVAGQATTYGTLATNYVTAYNLANADATRSPSNIIAKDDARRLVVANTRLLAGIIQKFPGTTDQMRSDLGLTVPAQRSPIPVPANPPMLEIKQRVGTTVRLKLHDNVGNRSKPLGVQGARVYSFVGAQPPVQIEDWVFEGQATRTLVDISFPETTAPGTVVWFTAQWYNPRGQTGPGCAPVSTNIAGGAMPMAG